MPHQVLLDIKAWVSAFRLRTLPLSFSLVLTGTAVASVECTPSASIFSLTLLTTLFLQILSNLSNDFGDSAKGVDGAGRVGPLRAIQSGAISQTQMKRAIAVFSILSLLSGVSLLTAAYDHIGARPVIVMLIIGLMCIAAAITYTVGKHPYGYAGLGDISVFIFFGIVGVVGTYFLQTGALSASVALPAVSIGFLSCGVLNMNNMRDIENDSRSGKRTFPTIIGIRNAAKYQFFLMAAAIICMTCHIILFGQAQQLLSLIMSVPFAINAMRTLKRYSDTRYLDSQLKVISISTFLMSAIFLATSFNWR